MVIEVELREKEESSYRAHTPQRHQGMAHGHHPDSKSPRCAKLLLSFSKILHFLQDAWCHLFFPSLYVSPSLQTEFSSTRMSCAKLLLRINFDDLVSLHGCVYILLLGSSYFALVVRVMLGNFYLYCIGFYRF